MSSAKISRTKFSMAGVKENSTPFRRSALIGRSLFDKSGKGLRTCLTSVGISILVNADTFSAFGCRPAGEREWARRFASVVPNHAFEGESLRLCFRRCSERERIVQTCATGSESNTITSSR